MSERLQVAIVARVYHSPADLVLLHGKDVTQEEIDDVILKNFPNGASLKVVTTQDARMDRKVIIGQEPPGATEVLSFGACPFEREQHYTEVRARQFNTVRLFLDIME